MMKIKTVRETNWKNYLIKADQFYKTAADARVKKNWNAVGLNTVHSAISANDALTVFIIGKRAASEKHSDSLLLLKEAFKNSKEMLEYSRHLQWLLGRKNLVEYESRLFYEREAEEALKHAERFFKLDK